MISVFLKKLRRKYLPGWNDEWPQLVERSKNCTSVQLGSGLATQPLHAINVDINSSTKPDVICDLNKKTFPFSDDSFDMVIAISILEHLKDFFSAMGEIHRISSHGATVHILVPHFSSAAAFVDPTHYRFFSARSCDYFVSETEIEQAYGFYAPYRFRMNKRYIELAGIWNLIPPLRWLVKRHTAFWENHLCFLIRGAGVYWELEVDKQFPTRLEADDR